jgi:hypothetical protein
MLRVGLLLDSDLKAFQAEIIQQIQTSEFARVALVIDDRKAGRSALTRTDRRRWPLLLKLYQCRDRRRFDRPLNPLRAVADTGILQSIPTVAPRGTNPGIIADIRSRALDVLLYLGSNQIDGAIHSVARFGAWTLRAGADASGPGELPFFLDVYDGNLISAIALHVASGDAARSGTVAKGYYSARRNSWLLNCIQPYWSSVTLVMQKLRELNDFGLERITHIASVAEGQQAARPSPVPTNLQLARWWAPRLIREKINRPRVALENHWRIATRAGRSPSLAESAIPDLSGFRVHESPTGHYYADPFLIQESGKSHIIRYPDQSRRRRHRNQ